MSTTCLRNSEDISVSRFPHEISVMLSYLIFIQQYNTDMEVSILHMKPLHSVVTSQPEQALDILSLLQLIITVFLSISE